MATIRDWIDRLRARFTPDAPGQGLMEYGLIISVVSIAAVVLIMAMGPRVASMFSTAGTSAFPSDRRRKANFAAVNGREVLARVVALPIQTWNYLSQGPSVRHIGPMAQDFQAAFGVGEDDTHINMVDASGVALAAIQGLYQLVQEQEMQLTVLEARLAALEAERARELTLA
jgi:Flp pilus assembly pilin Flp